MSQSNKSKSVKTEEKSLNPEPASEGVVKGRSLFVVETTAAGMAVHTAFLQEDGKLVQAPAVFPDVGYALSQVDELRSLLIKHFSQAAHVGAQVIASQAAKQNVESDTNVNVGGA